jgi:hypothetical protein
MSTSLLDQTPFEAPREPAAGVVAPTRPDAERPAPGLTVLALGAGELPVAGYLLRHGEAVTLVDDPPDALVATSALAGVGYVPYDAANMRERREQVVERALSATVHAGFSARAVETVPGGGLVERLRALPRGSVSCVAVSSRSAREVRRVARAAGAPVLALRPGAAAAGGPAVVAATDATWSVPAAARALATEHVLLVTRPERARRRGAGRYPIAGSPRRCASSTTPPS